MGGQAAAWADWCRNNTRVGPGFSNEELYQSKRPPPPSAAPRARAAPAASPPLPPYRDLQELLAHTDDLMYAARLPRLAETPLPVLCAMIEEDRPAFLEFIKDAGMETLAHRQRLTNALSKGLREGRVTRGWATPEPAQWETECGHCHKKASDVVKLSLCARCRGVKYCGALCQKAAWPGHKGRCQRPVANETKTVLETPSGHKSWASANPDPELLKGLESESIR
ncbi:hypothetical protein AB1Y20_015048 [Prymnesium parvum]|uniref:MYND-type domain-containing protein n=1 Tax=Prymnesium parvum TaxID=97485 RepID=A0AB34JVL8_PRYPA